MMQVMESVLDHCPGHCRGRNCGQMGHWNRILPHSGRVHSLSIPVKSSSMVPCNDVGLVLSISRPVIIPSSYKY